MHGVALDLFASLLQSLHSQRELGGTESQYVARLESPAELRRLALALATPELRQKWHRDQRAVGELEWAVGHRARRVALVETCDGSLPVFSVRQRQR